MARLKNPFAFSSLPVMVFTVLTYVALFTALIVTHTVVPPTPKHVPNGINLTEAWADLQFITSGYHPFNSEFNDDVRRYLLTRIQSILVSNGAHYALKRHDPTTRENSHMSATSVTVLDDLTSNLTFSGTTGSTSVYFEGNNIIVSIPGTEYGEECYAPSRESYHVSDEPIKGSVLVNAHFDSVSTGYGATDDGMGVVTVLQLLRYFTTAGLEPKRCTILLLNNGEEDYLNGARAFLRHPISRYAHTFLNLEGAGAGGRATLFRSTDNEVTRYYKRSKYPFGTVVSANGFQLGLIRSQTDYVVFNGDLGLRGLDVAFMEPRAKYHTSEDSVREASVNSLWHMLSASIATAKGLADDTSSDFDGYADEDGRVHLDKGNESIWFDLFGRAFAVFRLHTLFALSVTLLVFTPVLFISLTVFLVRAGKWYLFSRKCYVHSPDDDEAIQLGGWRGFFRFPIVLAISTAGVIGLAYLFARVNPLIVYGNEWAVWTSFLTAWFFVSWFLLRGADATRPSALQRMYTLIWLYVISFAILTAVTVAENKFHIAGGYFMVVFFAAISSALLISYLEMFALPTKSAYVELLASVENDGSSRPLTAGASQEEDVGESTETTSLLRGNRQSFARYGSRRQSTDSGESPLITHLGIPFGKEQPWSARLPSSLWLLQFLLTAPIIIVIVGQLGLLLTSALHQTPADGTPALTTYLLLAVFSVLIMLPLSPFLHRFTYHIPLFFFLVLVGTVIYNLTVFPFSSNNRLKVFFVQQVDCDTGSNVVSLTGLGDYVQDIISAIPSTAGQQIKCSEPDISSRRGLTKCSWNGILPRPVPELPPNSTIPLNVQQERNSSYTETWFKHSVQRTGPNSATFQISGRKTRACRLYFDQPIKHFYLEDGADDPRFPVVPTNGSTEIRLWSRDWDKKWNVDVLWDETDVEAADISRTGKVVCLWSDQNRSGLIPALEEIKKFMPSWSIVTKIGDGLVEGSKTFEV